MKKSRRFCLLGEDSKQSSQEKGMQGKRREMWDNKMGIRHHSTRASNKLHNWKTFSDTFSRSNAGLSACRCYLHCLFLSLFCYLLSLREVNSFVSCLADIHVPLKNHQLINLPDNFFEETVRFSCFTLQILLITATKNEATNWWFIHGAILLHLSLKIYDEENARERWSSVGSSRKFYVVWNINRVFIPAWKGN